VNTLRARDLKEYEQQSEDWMIAGKRNPAFFVMICLPVCLQSAFISGCPIDTSPYGDNDTEHDTSVVSDTDSDSQEEADRVSNHQTKVATSLGEINGFMSEQSVVAFLGIPYAQPPTGDLRFAPPVPLDSFGGPLNAFEFGPACPQPEIEPHPTMNSKMDEDCLTLNIWTPAADDRARPVMFWIHGGGFTYESSGDLIYNGARLAARGDVVVVGVEYRLGAMGFSYFEDVPGSGNAGLLDQVLALRWVQEHIEAFGGDPNNVTIFGESAGSYSVLSLMGMPEAEGLFHKGIGQSGGTLSTRQTDTARSVTDLLYEYSGTKTLAELRSLSWQEVVQAQDEVLGHSMSSDLIYSPVIDNVVFNEAPLHAIAKGSSAHVPLLVGTTKDETRYYMVDIPVLSTPLFTPMTLMTAVPFYRRAIPPGKTVFHATSLYQKTHFESISKPNHVALALLTDIHLRLPTLRNAEAQLNHQPQNVFVYRFDWAPPSPEYPGLELGAMHGAELGFVFGYPEGWPEIYGNSVVPKGLLDQIMDAWIAFAKTGNPNHGSIPTWQPYNLQSRPTMLFNTDGDTASSVVENDPDGKTRAFWDGVPFDGLNPDYRPKDLSTLLSWLP
jgi:para-nitrobenzyl esterase